VNACSESANDDWERPVPAASAADPALPCLKSSSLNGRTNRKPLFAAQENMRGYVRRVGEDRIGY